MRSCHEITQLISEGLDRPLPWHKRLAVRMHVLMCGSCAAYRRQMQALHRALKNAQARGKALLASGEGLTDQARQRIKQRLRKLK